MKKKENKKEITVGREKHDEVIKIGELNNNMMRSWEIIIFYIQFDMQFQKSLSTIVNY